MTYLRNDMKQQLLFSSQSLSPIISTKKNNTGAEFTVVSKATGKDFTFKISRSEWKGNFYTHIRVEKEYLNFTYVGSYYNGAITRKRKEVNTPAATAISWVLAKVEQQKFNLLDNSIELLHLGKCIRCGRKLTYHKSIKMGLGPICRNIK